MDKKEHIAYLRDFKLYSKEVTSSLESSKNFLKKLGVTTATGKLSKAYSSGSKPKRSCIQKEQV